MKKIIKEFVKNLPLFIFIILNCSLSVVLYSYISQRKRQEIVIIMLLFILLSSLICILFDMIKRKLTIEKPVKDILNATKKMAKGDFDILLLPDHKKNNYSIYDIIKEDLNLLSQELSKNEMLKNDFIANVSHEIKTPLAIIQNYVKALQNKNLDEDIKSNYMDIIHASTIKLNDLVTNILKLNKLENQTLTLDVKKFNLSNSIINQILQYETLIDAKNINLECNIDEDINIESEESYLEIIWNNLLSNAIKFTNNNGNISISLHKENEYIIFIIKDDGCGIDSETGKHIFDKFYQGETSHTKEGNGLGLSLVKKVVDIIGGEIKIKSEKNKGTEFIVKLKGDIDGR